ncbi:hypothetical protein MASR2M29_12650 [Spirochaetota bacterium]
MNILDYIFIAIMGIAALRCWFKGIITEVLSASAILGGLVSGIVFYQPLSKWIDSMWPIGKLAFVLGFLLAFAVVFITIKLLEKMLRDILENLNLNVLDKLFGLLFGILEGLVISLVIIIVLRYQPIFDSGQLLSESFIARLLLPIAVQGLKQFPPAGPAGGGLLNGKT